MLDCKQAHVMCAHTLELAGFQKSLLSLLLTLFLLSFAFFSPVRWKTKNRELEDFYMRLRGSFIKLIPNFMLNYS